jgi:hypothetical protein
VIHALLLELVLEVVEVEVDVEVESISVESYPSDEHGCSSNLFLCDGK